MASVEVELSCSMCQGFFRDLLPLTCGHSLCHSCLEDNWREQGCTLCRRWGSREPSPPNVAPRNISEDWQFTDDITVPLLPAHLRMVLVGKTGSGKSAAGNTILGREVFTSRASPKSVTKECQIYEVMSGEKTISVTDTPGVYDTDFTNEALKRELEEFINMTVPGPHVFLLVISVGVRNSREEKDAVQWICNHFGKEALQYAIILFTHTDQLQDTTLEQYVDESADLMKLISDSGGRFHGFNNNDRNPHQVTQLLQKIEHMVKSNRVRGREYYTNDMYERTQKQIEDARGLKKAKDVALCVASGLGVAATGFALGVPGRLALPLALLGAAVEAVRGVNKTSENRNCDYQRKNM